MNKFVVSEESIGESLKMNGIRDIAKKLAEQKDLQMFTLLHRNGIDTIGLTHGNAGYFRMALKLNGYEIHGEIELLNVSGDIKTGLSISQRTTIILKKDGIEIDRI